MNQCNVPDPLLSKLSKSERRMYDLLDRNGPTPTYVVRSHCSIGNPSETKRGINRKAKKLGDPRRVTCTMGQHINKYGERTKIGIWGIDVQPNRPNGGAHDAGEDAGQTVAVVVGGTA